MNAAEAFAYARQRDKDLRVSDFKYAVLWVTVDSVSLVEGAVAEQHGDHWFLFTEHHGYDVQHQDEVLAVKQFQRVPIGNHATTEGS